MKIGVIGANGFIGSHLSSRLLLEGHEVTAFYNTNKEFIPGSCRLIKVGDSDQSQLDFDVIYISVGSHQILYKERVNQMIQVSHLLDKFKFKRLILISSVSVYGSHRDIISCESSYNSPDDYGLSKLAFEYLINKYDKVVTLRFTYVYGFGMHSRSLVPLWIDSAKNKSEIVVYGDGSRKQDYLSVDDAVAYCLAALNISSKEVFICATGQSFTNLELANIIKNQFSNCKLLFNGNDTTSSQVFNIQKSIDILTVKEFITLNNGIEQMINDHEGVDL